MGELVKYSIGTQKNQETLFDNPITKEEIMKLTIIVSRTSSHMCARRVNYERNYSIGGIIRLYNSPSR